MGIVDYAWSHAVISDETHREIRESCDFKSSNPWINQTCCDAVDELLAQYHKIDMYSLYTPVCFATAAQSSNQYATQGLMSYKRTMKMVSHEIFFLFFSLSILYLSKIIISYL